MWLLKCFAVNSAFITTFDMNTHFKQKEKTQLKMSYFLSVLVYVKVYTQIKENCKPLLLFYFSKQVDTYK